jgi:hypothetical protein
MTVLTCSVRILYRTGSLKPVVREFETGCEGVDQTIQAEVKVEWWAFVER